MGWSEKLLRPGSPFDGVLWLTALFQLPLHRQLPVVPPTELLLGHPAPAEPDAAAGAEHRGEGVDHAAGHGQHGPVVAAAAPAQGHRQAVEREDQPPGAGGVAEGQASVSGRVLWRDGLAILATGMGDLLRDSSR